ncbi:sodium-dependent transporter [bacterium]|nr:sodium-dependent transporter [bacterium]
MPNRQLFSSRIATILTMIGVSVGLGNVWRFPYMMGQYGGSAFLLVYLIFTVAFAVPAVMAEWALGRETRKGPVGAFSAVLGPHLGKVIGYLLVFVVLVANSYYLVVVANVVYTTYFSVFQGFEAGSSQLFQAGLNHGPLQYLIAIGTLMTCLYVIYRGLNQGIESVSKLFVPFFSLVVVYLVINAFLLEGAPEKFVAFLKPDFSEMNAENVFAALGQAFFSLGLGGTFLLIYGSYLTRDQQIPKSAAAMACGDVGAALFASLFIVPSVLVFGIDLSSGPSLIFATLPELFAVMPAGRFLGSGFLLALAMVAFLSSVAALEVIIGTLSDEVGSRWSRAMLILTIGVLESLLMLPTSLNPNLIGTLDLIFGSGMQVFGSMLAAIGLAWGLGRRKALTQIFSKPESRWPSAYFIWIQWVVPAVLLLILISYIYTSIV